MFRSGKIIIIGTQCSIFITESLNFKAAKVLKFGLIYHFMAHAQPDTSIVGPV